MNANHNNILYFAWLTTVRVVIVHVASLEKLRGQGPSIRFKEATALSLQSKANKKYQYCDKSLYLVCSEVNN